MRKLKRHKKPCKDELKKKVNILLLFILLCSFISCRHLSIDYEEYSIITEVLNKSFADESDISNGLGWIDESKYYDKLAILNHTNLKDWDIKLIDDYIKTSKLAYFDIQDFKVNKIWEIPRIQGFDRYHIEELNDQKIVNPYIGLIQISAIAFSRGHNKAIIYTSFLCAGSGDCGIGQIFYLEKSKKWNIIKVEQLWVA